MIIGVQQTTPFNLQDWLYVSHHSDNSSAAYYMYNIIDSSEKTIDVNSDGVTAVLQIMITSSTAQPISTGNIIWTAYFIVCFMSVLYLAGVVMVTIYMCV